MIRYFVTGLSFAVLILLFGCGQGTATEVASCSGKVTLNGEPLTHGTVTFFLTGKGEGISAPLDAKGEYTLPAKVSAGEYQVAIVPYVPSPLELEQNSDLKVDLTTIPKKYQNFQTSGLQAQLKSGKNELTFELVP